MIVRLSITNLCTSVLPVAAGLISRVTGYVGKGKVLNSMICNCGWPVKKSYDLYPGEDEVIILGWNENEIVAEAYDCTHCGAQWELLKKDKHNLTDGGC